MHRLRPKFTSSAAKFVLIHSVYVWYTRDAYTVHSATPPSAEGAGAPALLGLAAGAGVDGTGRCHRLLLGVHLWAVQVLCKEIHLVLHRAMPASRGHQSRGRQLVPPL